MKQTILRSRAPVRIDFAGGWTDVAGFCRETPGYVVNAALNVYSYVTIGENVLVEGDGENLRERGEHHGITPYSNSRIDSACTY